MIDTDKIGKTVYEALRIRTSWEARLLMLPWSDLSDHDKFFYTCVGLDVLRAHVPTWPKIPQRARRW